MNDETLMDAGVTDSSAQIADGYSIRQVRAAQGESPSTQPTRPVAIAATFTADPLLQPLRFWLNTLELPAELTLAPYAQVIQELLRPNSVLSQNQTGFNILLIRLEDWIRDRPDHSVTSNVDHLRKVSAELVTALGVLRTRASAETLAFLCPPSAMLPADYGQALAIIQPDLVTHLSALPGVHCWTQADVDRLYPVAGYEDARADRIGHVPYTSEYFAALATLLARRMMALLKPQYKVIALDCDNTLWKGVCGEDGVTGVELTPPHLELQKLLVRQHDAGMLLCLCSKNNLADVEAVFAGRPEMPLREEHLISSRVNWSSKSSNLQSLADELGLSLDSFILIDDSAMECAEVSAHCPSVLALQFPQAAADAMHFMDHVWAFDRIGGSQEGKRRTAQYKQNQARSKALEHATDIEKFLASLNLEVQVETMQPEHVARVAELTQRTNQFNLTTIRRSASEVVALAKAGDTRILVVHVRDRFGDYGLVGALIFRSEAAAINVDTFVLSCRVLGRGVEHRIVNQLARVAQQLGLTTVVLRYRQTPRNAPARTFLEQSFRHFRAASVERGASVADSVFAIPVEYAERISVLSSTDEPGDENMSNVASLAVAHSPVTTQWHEAAYRLSRIADLMREIDRVTSRERRGGVEYLAPRSPTETAVATIWSEVLRLQDVGVRDDFLELGGDSLMAVQVISRIGSVLGLELPLHKFLEAPTVEEIARQLAGASRSGPAITRLHRQGPAPLSSAQQRLWFIDQLEGSSAAYHIPLAMRVVGEVRLSALQTALDALVRRHEALRTVFAQVDGEPVQTIVPNASFALQLVDLRALETEQRETQALGHSRDELTAPFDLSAGPLIRGRLLLLSERDQVLLVTMHHIVSDGWSVGVLIRELGALYAAHCDAKADPLPALPIQYADYAQWHRQSLENGAMQEQLQYWLEHLRGAPDLLELPTDRPRPPVQSYRGGSVSVALGTEFSAEIKDFSRRHNLTLAMTLYTAWLVVLSRLSGQQDLVVGMPVANRRRTELEGLIGFFVNTLAVRVRLDDDPRVTDLLQRVKDISSRAYAHQDVPFEQVVEGLQPTRSLSHNAVFQVMFALQNAPRDALQLPGLTLSEQEVALETAQFDLTLSLQESAGAITGSLNYASDLFDPATISRWVGCFDRILQAIVRHPDLQVSRLPLISEEDRDRVIKRFNATQADYPREQLIHEVFEAQVERTPDAVAVVYEERSLSYVELNRKANQLAGYLRQRGAQSGEFVPILMTRSLQMLVAQLAVLKSGGVYVPVDPELPAERRDFMIRDCGARRVLIDGAEPTDLAAEIVEWIDCTHGAGTIGSQPVSNLHLSMDPATAAYVMYTSGSTGVPKGVIVPHYAVNRLAINNGYARIGPEDCLVHYSNPAFDASTFEIWGALLNGARVVIVPQFVVLEATRFVDLLKRERVTLLWMTVGLFNQYTRTLATVFTQLRYLIVGGDVLEPGTIRRVLQESPPGCLLSAYGPTECTTFSTTYPIESASETAKGIPIGRPMSNAQIYILDRHGQAAPIGVGGEIYIGGAGVACGYLNRPELTAERFLPDPFSADPQARVYKTGDLGRWRADGAIEFLGRNDQQVKIRGYRIELGEIEAQLVRHEQVKEAVVIARQDSPGEKRLVAYVTPVSQLTPDAEKLRAHLQAVLPEYMLPGAFVTLERLPLTSTGKLDRKALPAPHLGAYVSHLYQAPQGDVEEILAGIWQTLLRVERVGRRDNFFELGGHSLLIVQMMERLRRVGLSAEVRRVFESPTLADLASALTRGATERLDAPPNLIPPGCDAITPPMLPLVELHAQHIDRIVTCVPGCAANIQDIYPLAPLQEGILFHHLLNRGEGDPYVFVLLLSVSSRERLKELIAALQSVIDRHDVLRTAVLWDQLPAPVQVVCRRVTLPVETVELRAERDLAEQLKEWTRPERQRMDLRQAPLMRLQIAADTSDAQWHALLQLHHITVDGESLRIVTSEVMAQLEGRAHLLPDSVPYRNHVAQALAYARTHDAEAFFRSKLQDVDEPSAPFELLDVHGAGTQIREASGTLDPSLAHRIRTQARSLGVSAATLFHAAWGLVIAATSGGRGDVVFGSVLLGRLQGSAGAQRILGMFINTLPLRLRLQGMTAKELVEHTQRELVELLSHEQASLAVAQRCSGIAGPAPLFTALLNYRHSVRRADEDWANANGIKMLAARNGTNYPVTLSVDDLGEGFELLAQTDRRIDPQLMIGYLRTVMQSLVLALEQASPLPVQALSILADSERQQVLERFNARQAGNSQETCLQELFEAQVQRTPDAIAVVYEGQSCTYAQLNRRANQLARHLMDKGVGPDCLVALCLERSGDMVLAVLGILKAGAAYVPLDPDYPADRLRYMLLDAAPLLIVTQEKVRAALPATPIEFVALDVDWQQIARHPDNNLEPGVLRLRSSHLAYVIYTSGSTGQPKGVMIEHRHVVNLWQGLERLYETAACQRIALNASLNFDASVQQLVQLLSGRTLFVVPQACRRDASMLVRFMREHRIEGIDCTPSQLRSWLATGLFNGRRSSLRLLLVGGEAIDSQLWSSLAQCSELEVVNVYGPTECTVDVTVAHLNDREIEPHIGRPMANRRVYILDRCGLPVPIGVVGEIHVGGSGIARGYLNRPELTAQRFVSDPFSADRHARMYKTGDLGRWRADGKIDYVGRNDHQVKLRGFRIELGEIEARLAHLSQVKEAVVIAREDAPGEKRLVAYLVPSDTLDAPPVDALRAHLKDVLPEHMVPSAFVTLERMPLTPSGKLDRRALPMPELGAYATRHYQAPQGEVEELLATIWQELLHIERVGRDDNFFELGGNSLVAMQVLTRVQAALSIELPMRWLFEYPTAQLLSEQLDELRHGRLRRRVQEGGEQVDELLDSVASMPESEVRELLRALTLEGGL